MAIIKKEPIFNIDDWVVIREDITEDKNNGHIDEELSQFKSPQKIVKIGLYRMGAHNFYVYHIGREGNIIETINNFRLATDKEIKEQTIKNVFLN